MSEVIPARNLPWLRSLPPRPLCDVPWQGTSVILATGELEFCCFSNARIGNVNEQTFEEIWNGPRMRSIRQALAAQTFPVECQSNNCPIYRGDKHHYINLRMEGMHRPDATGSTDPHRELRAAFAGTRIDGFDERAPADGSLWIQYAGDRRIVDVFAALSDDTNRFVFLPGASDFPLPAYVGVSIGGPTTSVQLPLVFRGSSENTRSPARSDASAMEDASSSAGADASAMQNARSSARADASSAENRRSSKVARSSEDPRASAAAHSSEGASSIEDARWQWLSVGLFESGSLPISEWNCYLAIQQSLRSAPPSRSSDHS